MKQNELARSLQTTKQESTTASAWWWIAWV